MGQHAYENPGPVRTTTRTDLHGVMAVPAVTTVHLLDGVDDHIAFEYTDLDALDETIYLFLKARSDHLAAIIGGRSEMVRPDVLEPGDLVVLDVGTGELVMVDAIVIVSPQKIIVRFCRKYEGSFDGSPSAVLSVELYRAVRVKRLMPDATLAVVR